MKPMKDLILIEMNQVEKEKQTSSGLLIAAPAWGKPEQIGKVISVGPAVTDVEEGGYYMINPYAARETAQKNVMLVREKDFLCRITDINEQ